MKLQQVVDVFVGKEWAGVSVLSCDHVTRIRVRGETVEPIAVLVVENDAGEVQRLTAPAFRNGPLPERRVLVILI